MRFVLAKVIVKDCNKAVKDREKPIINCNIFPVANKLKKPYFFPFSIRIKFWLKLAIFVSYFGYITFVPFLERFAKHHINQQFTKLKNVEIGKSIFGTTAYYM